MRFPGKMPDGMVVKEPVSQLDVFHSILDYLGAPQVNGSDGKSLRRHIEVQNYNSNYDDGAVVAELEKVGKNLR